MRLERVVISSIIFSNFVVDLYAIENGKVLDPDTLVDRFSQLNAQQRALLLQAGFIINYEVVYYYYY